MPEGDSYTYAAHRIRPILTGHLIHSVEGSSPDVRKRSGQIVGNAVSGIRTVGKHLLIDLDSGLSIHVHLGMTGAIRIRRPGRGRGADRGALRLALSTELGTVEVTAAPTVDVERRGVIDHGLKHLGPDLLAPDFDRERFERLAALFPDDRSVSDFLLEQRVMSGIGNEYKSEVLFLEGIRPDRLMETVDPGARLRLAERARRLMQPNARRPSRSTTGRADGSKWVYGRSGRPCRRCRTAIVGFWPGNPPRVTYWCPSCQT